MGIGMGTRGGGCLHWLISDLSVRVYVSPVFICGICVMVSITKEHFIQLCIFRNKEAFTYIFLNEWWDMKVQILVTLLSFSSSDKFNRMFVQQCIS